MKPVGTQIEASVTQTLTLPQGAAVVTSNASIMNCAGASQLQQ
ncbi:hypothetical protein [Leptolyngbya ohadii]|nr:hypothetical protein [Leptolyngbya ohadii]